MMPSQIDDLKDGWDDYAAAKQLFERYKSFHKHALRERYGAEILALSGDDEGLLACVESGEPRLQRMALCSLIHLRYIYHPRIIEKCAEYIVSGNIMEIRGLCIDYLSSALVYEDDYQIMDVLQKCASRLRGSRVTRDDDCVIYFIEVVVRELWAAGGSDLGRPND